MRWFKHDSDASSDARIRKLLIKHGAIGYAVYFHCLELVAGDVCEGRITFELEHDCEIIADNLKIQGNANEAGVDLVNRIMRTIIDLGLFEEDGGRVFCLKMAKRLDSSMASGKMRKLIESVRNSDAVMISHDTVMQDKNRTDKNRKEIIQTGFPGTPVDVFSMTDQVLMAATSYWASIKRPDIDAEDEFKKFRAHHRSRGTKSFSWPDLWELWFRQAPEFLKKVRHIRGSYEGPPLKGVAGNSHGKSDK